MEVPLERLLFQKRTLEYKIKYLQDELKNSKESLKQTQKDLENLKNEKQLGLFDENDQA